MDASLSETAIGDRELRAEQVRQVEANAQSLALMPAGLEVVPSVTRRRSSSQSGKEALARVNVHSGLETCETALHYDPPLRSSRQRIQNRRFFGARCGLCFAFLLLLILGLALGVGLGVGLGFDRSRSHSTTSSTSHESTNSTDNVAETRIGGNLDAAYYSTNGAWNGTAFSTLQRVSPETTSSYPILYFQHYSGDVRWMELLPNGSWIGGTSLETVANDAKNNTPISAVTWILKEVTHTHVFCTYLNEPTCAFLDYLLITRHRCR